MTSLSSYKQHQDKVKVVAGYALQQKLGSGSFATVYRGVRLPQTQATIDTVAIKAITRNSEKLTKKVLQNLEIEISILRTYRHPNIVCLHDVQKTERHFYLLLEYCGGGDVQGLIRRRKAGRLSERLTRRLARDLASGLKFLWSQELIHRDIKPQNLLLTGPLPLDEKDDPEKTPELEQLRQQTNFPSAEFSLKIADFGFARHLQTSSLAETLCGSPLYMAPEILQHHRYDAKADLWSAGTVLFEMICGRPPFNGENHIDLLRNIQRKAVRLPADVRVSKECVNLLRVLLNRNPISRAGFKEFFAACDAFVGLGCNGPASPHDTRTPQEQSENLASISEKSSPLSDSLHTVETTNSQNQHQDGDLGPSQVPGNDPSAQQVESPPRAITPNASALSTPFQQPVSTLCKPYPQTSYAGLKPLQPSPPLSSRTPTQSVPGILAPPSLGQTSRQLYPTLDAMQQTRRSEGASSAENSFVMVEHGGANVVPAENTQSTLSVPKGSVSGTRRDYMILKQAKGMLSTSPGTGGALLNMLSGRNRLLQPDAPGKQFDTQVAHTAKLLAASEDVGRRAVSVAHVGDSRAFAGMRMLQMAEVGASSLVSSCPMEGIIEETEEAGTLGARETSARRRRSSSATDKSMPDIVKPEDELGEMPFALNSEPPSTVGPSTMPSRESVSFAKGSSITIAKSAAKPTVATIRTHLQEALSCYLKALKILKSSVNAIQHVSKDIESLSSARLSKEHANLLEQTKRRCGVTLGWLSEQFNGVLDRANAANSEIRKMASTTDASSETATSAEELIYNASIACGREGAVKHLLGQNEAARCSYRSAGLLAETLLMESGLGAEDRRVLEDYVDGFAARITELDDIMLQQSRMAVSGASGNSRRVPSVVPSVIGLVNPSIPMGSPHL